MFQSQVFWILLFGSALIYWRLPLGARHCFLALVSFGYAFWLAPMGTVILAGWVLLFFYVAPMALADGLRARFVTLGLISAILGYLFWNKYLPSIWAFIADASPGVAIAIPLGISYYTFKLIHYAIETARGNIEDRSLSRFFCYIFLFPIFTAGPIERFDHFVANSSETWNPQFFVFGATRIIYGLIKTFVLLKFVHFAFDKLGLPPTSVALIEGFSGYDTVQIWTFLSLSYLYAYLDFSAYSDIAIGASMLFGFRIMENFNWPILAINIQDFWRRWHMTLAKWCQSYIYLPVLARSRSPYVAVVATFTCMGAWHGASFGWILWGLYHAAGLSAYMTWARYMRRFEWWHRAQGSRLRYLGLPVTFAYVSGSYAFSSMGGGLGDSVMVFVAIFGVRIF